MEDLFNRMNEEIKSVNRIENNKIAYEAKFQDLAKIEYPEIYERSVSYSQNAAEFATINDNMVNQ